MYTYIQSGGGVLTFTNVAGIVTWSTLSVSSSLSALPLPDPLPPDTDSSLNREDCDVDLLVLSW